MVSGGMDASGGHLMWEAAPVAECVVAMARRGFGYLWEAAPAAEW
jgi:hypothetical protein